MLDIRGVIHFLSSNHHGVKAPPALQKIAPGVEFEGFLEYWRQQVVGISTDLDVFWELR